MIPIIPKQREFKTSTSKPFNDLIKYIQGVNEKGLVPVQLNESLNQFSEMLDYATAEIDSQSKGEKCIAIRTHGVTDLATAAIEMNAVAGKNNRCTDPVYHFILSWPEHEQPSPNLIFDAAEHAIKALGVEEHQYVVAVHANTDNMHCHISVNRIHPKTFKSRNIEWAKKTLHFAARQSEIKHGWTHDNGIYVVQENGHGEKQIVLNTKHKDAIEKGSGNSRSQVRQDALLPTWHDPDGLESWLKSKIARKLKTDLDDLQSWSGLHAWLGQYGIRLTNTGGGGLRLHATSMETGEVLDLPASKGLRIIKRTELEQRWGTFSDISLIAADTPDFSKLTQRQITKGVDHVINRTLDRGNRPPDHVLRPEQGAGQLETEGAGSLYDLSNGGLDGIGSFSDMLLQSHLSDGLGDEQTRQDSDVRRAGDSAGSSGNLKRAGRDQIKREERKQQRAASRADLRQRFAQYRRFVRESDSEYFIQLKQIKGERSKGIKALAQEKKQAISAISKQTDKEVRFVSVVAIDLEIARKRLLIDAQFQERSSALRATRAPALGWRTWLHEQSNLGDKAALSALRGIVYQAQRDAKGAEFEEEDENEAEKLEVSAYHEKRYKRIMDRLLEEERREAAIRAANIAAIRPYEADALLLRYAGLQWHVTGNGNVEYSDMHGAHIFTDRGNRVTFDRVKVTDEEIRVALVHSQQKFGKQITLTGTDSVFSARMAKIADDLGMTVLNPSLQSVIQLHRKDRKTEMGDAAFVSQTEQFTLIDTVATEEMASHDQIHALVRSIDPNAAFVQPDLMNSSYVGPVAAEIFDPVPMFAQHIGRGQYVVHLIAAPLNHNQAIVQVNYANNLPVVNIENDGKGGPQI